MAAVLLAGATPFWLLALGTYSRLLMGHGSSQGHIRPIYFMVGEPRALNKPLGASDSLFGTSLPVTAGLAGPRSPSFGL